MVVKRFWEIQNWIIINAFDLYDENIIIPSHASKIFLNDKRIEHWSLFKKQFCSVRKVAYISRFYLIRVMLVKNVIYHSTKAILIKHQSLGLGNEPCIMNFHEEKYFIDIKWNTNKKILQFMDMLKLATYPNEKEQIKDSTKPVSFGLYRIVSDIKVDDTTSGYHSNSEKVLWYIFLMIW